ncbi:histidine kinase [Prolixibacteraceae bacterium JC049]|nr:histidine kinase [Prolixibacteraceae bacterium JC049]
MIKIERKIWLPIVIWVALFLFVFNIANYFQDAQRAAINAFYEVFMCSTTYYLTTMFLFPRFYKMGKKYIWISMLTISILAIGFTFFDYNFLPHARKPDGERVPIFFIYLRFFFNLGFVYFVATSISLIEQTQALKASEKILTEEKLATELKLLKAQINPHFIFNALNNIYSLTYMQSRNAPESVLKLSEMLRYVFYDCSKDRVTLTAELNYIENFTAFQQMKSDFMQNISVETNIQNRSIELAPMLFIPFIENAYKYSRIEENETAFVHIKITSDEESIHFCIENSAEPGNLPTPGSGMGIKNVKHRLGIIYPEKHELNLVQEENVFRVNLKLNII